MNKVSTYLLSLIMTILLIIAMTASTAMVIADINVTEKKASAISSKGNIPAKIVTQLDKYYRSKAGATGIPANVYMDSISEEYISSAVDSCLAGTFSSLKENKSFSASVPENKALEDSINKFFNDYADQSGYEKDDAFYKNWIPPSQPLIKSSVTTATSIRPHPFQNTVLWARPQSSTDSDLCSPLQALAVLFS